MHQHHIQDDTHLLRVIILLLIYLGFEVAGGILTGSLALISDAAHMLTDIVALLAAWIALKISRKPTDMKKTFGYYRFEILIAAFNTLLLFLTALYIFYEALLRLYYPESVHGQGMFFVGVIGLIINIIALKILNNTHHKENLSFKSAYFEVFSDLLSALGVLVTAIVIHFYQYSWLDSLVAVLIACWMLPRSWVIFKESMEILLESVPKEIHTPDVYQLMSSIPGVLNIHDLHIWSITKKRVHLTAHVIIDDNARAQQILISLQALLHEKFEIMHTTLQLETQECIEKTKH